MTEHKHAAARREAEQKIQRILLDLEEDTDEAVYAVEVDTRLFANLKVEIFFETDRP